jgi:phage tail sheath protein FI
MPQYLAPGVYVEEVPSAIKPIAGVGTSTGGFIGAVAVTHRITNPRDLLRDRRIRGWAGAAPVSSPAPRLTIGSTANRCQDRHYVSRHWNQ